MKKQNIITLIVVSLLFLMSLLQAREKIQIDLGGSYLFSKPQQFNYLAESERQYHQFYFDPIYESKTEKGSLNSLKYLYSLSVRMKYALSSSFQLSLGLTYLWKNQSDSYQVDYFRDEGWRTISDVLNYREFGAEISSLVPTIGLHYSLLVSTTTKVEFSLAAGPVFASILFSKELAQAITSNSELSFPFYTSDTVFNMDGKGTGICVSGSLKLQQALGKFFGLFLEGGYFYQQVFSIEGQGTVVVDGNENKWEGEWVLVKEKIQTSWGEAEFLFPHNDPAVIGQRGEDFDLDLSGFAISVGFYIKL